MNAESLCERLPLFLAGELDEAEADDFRLHLGECDECGKALHDEMMMEALEQTREPRVRRNAAQARSFGGKSLLSRRLARVAAGAALGSLLAAAGFALIVHERAHLRDSEVALLSLESAKMRPSEIRLAYRPADLYRPYDVARSSGGRRHEDVSLQLLAELEAKGDYHGLAVGLILAGEDARAASYLERAPADVDVSADKAALLVEQGNLREALAALDSVLAKSPNHPQALWNRALVLRNLDLPLAAEAFDRVAALGEKGWADDARGQAARLRAREKRGEDDARKAPSQ